MKTSPTNDFFILECKTFFNISLNCEGTDMASGNPILNALNRVSLVAQIAIGLVLGILVGAVFAASRYQRRTAGQPVCRCA